MTRTRILSACLALFVALGIWRWLSAERSITLNVTNAPLSKVLKEFERQGGIKIVSNIDPAKTVTLFFNKTPVFDALETLSIRADASWKLAYLAAPKKAQIDAVLTAFTNQDTSQPAWNSYQLRGGGGGGGGGWFNSDAPGDPRIVNWQVTPGDPKDLGSYFAQAAQKTPAFFAVAPDWNPTIAKVPNSGPLKKSVPNLVSQAGGTVREVFMLEGRPNFRPEGEGDGPPAAGAPPPDWGNRGPQRGTFANSLRREQTNPEWMAQRAEEAIKQLPPDQQAQAHQDMQDMRNFMEEMRKLSPEERRAKMEEAMNDPKLSERMEERAASRDSRMGPTQRAERSKRYVKNKVEAREKAGNPMTPKN